MRNSTEDPLEGPSWRFKNDQDQNDEVEKNNDYSVMHVCDVYTQFFCFFFLFNFKFTFQRDSLLENIKQLSNSNISESDDEKSDLIIPPQSQSTPKQSDNVVPDFTIKNDDNNFVIPENIVEQSRLINY